MCTCPVNSHRPRFTSTPTTPPAAHPHTKLATLVYCESLCCDVALVGEMLNGDMGPALVRGGVF